jgi:Ca2+/Na+ antiporter
MELDELKNLWQQDTVHPKDSALRLNELLARKSNSPLSKMKRNLNWELWAIIVLYGTSILFYFTAWNGKMESVGWFMLALALLFFLYYFLKIRLINKMANPAGQVKQTLQHQITTLETFVRLYFIAGTVLIPVSMLFFGRLYYIHSRYIKPGNILFPSDENPIWKVLLAWTLLISVITYFSLLMNKWYVNKLYSRHINKLKSILKEMEEE